MIKNSEGFFLMKMHKNLERDMHFGKNLWVYFE